MDTPSKKRRRLVKPSDELLQSPARTPKSCLGKRRRLVKPSDELLQSPARTPKSCLGMVVGSCYFPKDNEEKPLGEDAHFIYDEKLTFGLADGVGKWAKMGIDAGKYARELMSKAVLSLQDQPEQTVDPKQVLNEAFLNTDAIGSSTACIVTLKGDYVHAVNLGDSGFMVIRDGSVVYQSPVQQNRFNCPYQLGTNSTKTPSCAQEIVVEVQSGDVIVAATDGLFDNVYVREIEDLVDICRRKQNLPELMACCLASMARDASLEKDSCSPFTEAAKTAGFDLYENMGGKPDDITVIVAYVL